MPLFTSGGSRRPGLVAAPLQSPPPASHGLLLRVSLPFSDPCHRFRTHLTIQDSPISTSLIHPHARDSFQIRPHSQGADIRIQTYLWEERHHLIYDGAQESITFKWISKVIWMHWELPTRGSNCLANSSSSECLACVRLVSLIGLSLLLGTGALMRIQHTYDREVTQGCCP